MVFFCWLICSVFLLLPISRETLMFKKKTFIHSLTLSKYPIIVLSRFPPVRCFQLATCCLGVVGGTDRCHIFLSISDPATSFLFLQSGGSCRPPLWPASPVSRSSRHYGRKDISRPPSQNFSVQCTYLNRVCFTFYCPLIKFATLLTSILKEHIQF